MILYKESLIKKNIIIILTANKIIYLIIYKTYFLNTDIHILILSRLHNKKYNFQNPTFNEMKYFKNLAMNN